jgi:hypothetical protein
MFLSFHATYFICEKKGLCNTHVWAKGITVPFYPKDHFGHFQNLQNTNLISFVHIWNSKTNISKLFQINLGQFLTGHSCSFFSKQPCYPTTETHHPTTPHHDTPSWTAMSAMLQFMHVQKISLLHVYAYKGIPACTTWTRSPRAPKAAQRNQALAYASTPARTYTHPGATLPCSTRPVHHVQAGQTHA